MSFCPELYIASPGDNVNDVRNNLQEALALFFETASREEIQERLHDEVYVTRVEVAVGKILHLSRITHELVDKQKVSERDV